MSKGIPTGHVPNIRHLELHITYRCNLRCLHCSNLIEQAPSNETMSLERIDDLLKQSILLSWPWEWIVLHGGEPTLHPKFEEICELLAAYKESSNPTVNLFVCTNGHGEFVQKQIEIARKYGIQVENSGKDNTGIVGYHVPLSVSPEDSGEDFHLGCFQSSKCGICYTNQGFYECSPAGAAHRVFGYEPMALTLEEVTEEKLAEGFLKHCRHCGYAKVIHGVNTDGHKGTALPPDPTAPMSPTWARAIEGYKSKKA